jgi:hypothetical protein
MFAPRFWKREAQHSAAVRLADALQAALCEQVRLTIHDNRSTMLSYQRRDTGLHVRLHHMFLDAPEDVVRAVADFASGRRLPAPRRRVAGNRIDAYVKEHRRRIGEPRADRVNPQGRVHDLQAIFDRLNAEHFDGRIEARIGWGAVRGLRRRHTIKTGVYVEAARLIRIHAHLDRPGVPEFYVAMVVFHEMLHQAIPAVERGGRRVVHGPDFRRRERAYPDFERARLWEERHLGMLLAPRQ